MRIRVAQPGTAMLCLLEVVQPGTAAWYSLKLRCLGRPRVVRIEVAQPGTVPVVQPGTTAFRVATHHPKVVHN